jgi:putative ABC transport system permease protein
MSRWSRILNVLRSGRLIREIDEELESHMQEAIEHGRDPVEARRAFGSTLRHREESRDVRVIAWLESLRADAVYGLRRLTKTKVTSTTAILSLAIAIGACTCAFRLIDALLVRPLPISAPDRLYALSTVGADEDGKPETWDSYPYPLFSQMRSAVKDQADLLAVSYTERTDLTYKSDQEMEKAHLQYVSASMFATFGLRPASGRLLTENDDLKSGTSPFAVLSYEYWTQRFGKDPKVIGRAFRLGNTLYEIVGVVEKGFTGTETGTVTDVFVPITMRTGSLECMGCGWLRILAEVRPGGIIEPIRDKLRASFQAFHEERIKSWSGMPQLRERELAEKLLVEPSPAGVSELQKNYARPLGAFAVLLVLVLLIACANVANLMTAQAAARAREMALRVSIGAGRLRVIQLLLVESAWIASLAAAIGGMFAWWSAPLVVMMVNPRDNPARLILPADWRILGFGLALTAAVTCLFGLLPALRASKIQPASALKGGEDPRGGRREMLALIVVQAAFCFLMLFVAALFVTTFERLSNQPNGFSAERVLVLETIAAQAASPASWAQVAEHLRTTPGVESVALAGWPLLTGRIRNNFISVNGGPPSRELAWFINVSPGWFEAMRISLVDGRDFRPEDADPDVAIVSEMFAKRYFNGENAVGKWFEKTEPGGKPHRFEVVGVARDARYRDIRGPLLAVFYVPFQSRDDTGAPRNEREATLLVKTSSPRPLALAPTLRQEVPRARSEFRVSNIRTQLEINESQTIRERLLAMLAFFFAGVALLLAGVGLYGMLHYSVLQRRREIGIRIAVGAQVGVIARLVTADVFLMVLVGALAGLALGMTLVRYIETLFYQVKATDVAMLAFPSLILLVAALLAALPPVIHAVRIDPVRMLRAE